MNCDCLTDGQKIFIAFGCASGLTALAYIVVTAVQAWWNAPSQKGKR